MNKTRGLFINILSHTKIPALARKLLVRNGRFVLMFHGVYKKKYPELPDIMQRYFSEDEFSYVLDWLKFRFSFLSPKDFLNSNKPGVLLTFDDGFANNANNALPVLEKFNAPAVFFVTTQHVMDPENWLPATSEMIPSFWGSPGDVPASIAADLFNGMSEPDLIKCAQHPLITIGSHTVSHPYLTKCTHQQVTDELISSRNYIKSMTGQKVDLLAYPSGDYDRHVAETAKRVGYVAAFAVNCNKVGIPNFEIPRIGLFQPDPAYLDLKLSGLFRVPIKPDSNIHHV